MTDLLWSVTFVNSVEACFKHFIELASFEMRWESLWQKSNVWQARCEVAQLVLTRCPNLPFFSSCQFLSKVGWKRKRSLRQLE